jgi:hypothetical protein
MAEKLDIASRLAEGRPAVDNIQTYVLACHVLGYTNPDLTLHASQVSDWYGSEDGLDLRALDADCGALEAAVAATEDALTRQDDQLGALSTAWQGRSADVSREFLRMHGEASSAARPLCAPPRTRWPRCETTCGTPSMRRSQRRSPSRAAHLTSGLPPRRP